MILVLLRYLAFLPSVTFNLIKGVEIFPWASLYIFSTNSISSLYKYYKFFIIYIALSSIYSIFFIINNSSVNTFFEIIRSLTAYLNVLIIFVYLLNANKEQIELFYKTLRNIFIFFILLGFFQFFGFLNKFNFIIEFFVPRASMDVSGYGGITLLSSEPSRAAPEFFFLSTIFLLKLRLCNEDFVAFIFLIFILLVTIFVFKSVDGFVVATVAIFILYPLFFITFTLIVFLFFLLAENTFLNNRLLIFLTNIREYQNFELFFDYVSDRSGFRVSSIVSSFYYGFQNLFGGGVGLWKTTSLEALNNGYFKPESIDYFIQVNNSQFTSLRPSSFIANVFLDYGFYGFLVFIISFFLSIYNYINKETLPYLLIFIFCMFFVSSVGNPVLWIVLALIFKIHKLSETK